MPVVLMLKRPTYCLTQTKSLTAFVEAYVRSNLKDLALVLRAVAVERHSNVAILLVLVLQAQARTQRHLRTRAAPLA